MKDPEKKPEGIPVPPGLGIPTPPTPKKVDWVDLVNKSKDMFFVSKDALKDYKKIEDLRKSFNKMAEEMAEKEIELNILTQNFFYGERVRLAKEGEKPWMKTIAMNLTALQDGQYVLVLSDDNRSSA